MKALIRTLAAACLVIGMTIVVRSSADGQKAGDVSEARVIAEASEGNNWLVAGGSFDEQHFSPLKQVTDKNIGTLGLAWALDIKSPFGMTAEPIVVDGVIYVSAPLSRVYAVDAASGKELWTFDPKVRMDKWWGARSARTNRGVAVWGGKVFVGTGDCRLVAIDAASGKQVWQSPVCDYENQPSGITGAPHVGKGKVFIGYYGSDNGTRGSVPAFDAETGKELWRFWTVPADPVKFESKALEMAAKTWVGEEWWKAGGGAVWDPITYDPVTNLVMFGTAGASPSAQWGDKGGMKLYGDRLFSGSIIAVNADTGEYVWHYQTSTENYHTENNHIVVADLVIDGQKRHVAMTAPKNGLLYVLDARTGHLLAANKIAKVAWANSYDPKTGRDEKVVEVPVAEQRAQGGINFMAHNWFPMSYSPLTGLVYLPLNDRRNHELAPGEEPLEGKLLAWDPVRQSARWFVEQPLLAFSGGGVLSTAGNLVFQGEGTGEFAAYSADSGQKVWSIKTHSAITATPVSFAVKGEQYVVIPVGWGSGQRNAFKGSTLATPEAKRGPSRLLAFKLGAKTPFPATVVEIPTVPKPPEQTASKAMIQMGRNLYHGGQFCHSCHAAEADGSGAWELEGSIPDLRYMPLGVHSQWDAIVLGGIRARNGMPGFGNPPGFPLVTGKMTQLESDAIHAYVIDMAWKAYNEEQNNLKAKEKK